MNNTNYCDLIESYYVEGERLEVKICEALKQEYIAEDFWMIVENTSLEKIPEDILLIPFILNIAPIIWISNLNLEIETMDSNLADSLEQLKKVFKEMFPTLPWGGNLKIKKRTQLENPCKPKSSTVLFSGGLDSIATSYNHIAERQTLVTIQGSDVEMDDTEGWKIIQKATIQYGEEIGAKYFFVQSNFTKFLNNRALSTKSGVPWWGFIQHGMGLSSFMAIPAFLTSSSVGYIGSTHSSGFYDKPWGSHPKIDNNIRWTGFKIIHDCYDLTRQGKINLIREAVENGKPKPFLRVCYSSRGGKNCGFCEKCCRTMTALVISGGHFRDYGFELMEGELVHNTRTGFKKGKFKFDENTLFHWEDIKSAIEEEEFYKGKNYSGELLNFIAWLKNYDLKSYKKRQQQRIFLKEKTKKTVNKIPGLFPTIKAFKGFIHSN